MIISNMPHRGELQPFKSPLQGLLVHCSWHENNESVDLIVCDWLSIDRLPMHSFLYIVESNMAWNIYPS